MKILALVLFTVLTLLVMQIAAGIGAFADSITFIYVLFGAALFVIAKAGLSQNLNQVLQNFGQGAVYSGWLGLLIGAVAIAKNTPLEALGPAISIALLPVLYAYFFKWVVVTALGSSRSADE